MRKTHRSYLKKFNMTRIFHFSFFIPFLVFTITSIHSPTLKSQELDVFTAQSKSWLRFTNAPNSLNLHLLDEAEKLFRERDQEISKIQSLTDVQDRQQKVRETLTRLNPLNHKKTALNAHTTRTLQKEEYSVELIVFESQPGFFVTGSLFIPHEIQEPSPAILFCSGHSAQAYRRDIYQLPLLNLVKKGFIVFAIDPPGQGERLQYPDSETGQSKIGSSTKEHSYPMAQTGLIGENVAQYFIWDGIRAIDYLVSRPEVDPDRIGVHGLSGGGTQTAYISAFDERVKAAAPSGYITNFRRLFESIGAQDGEQNFYKGIASGIDHPELLLARAPKPTLIMATTRDFFSIEGTRETFKEMSRIYEYFGEKDKITITEGDHGHGYTKNIREAMYAFFQENLDLPGSSEEEDVALIPEEELRITETGQVSSSYASKNIFDLNKEKSAIHLKTLEENRKNPDAFLNGLPDQVKNITGYEKPEGVGTPFFTGRIQREGYSIEKYFIKGEGNYSLPYLLFLPENKNEEGVLYLHPEGKGAAAGYGAEGEIEKLVREGFVVMAADLPGIGELSPEIAWGDAIIEGVAYNAWFTGMSIGRSILGIRAGDVIRLAQVFDKNENVRNITGWAKDGMGPVLLHAAVFDDLFQTILLDGSLVDYESVISNEFYQPALVPHLVPGALLSYDLPDLAAGMAPQRLIVVHARDEGGDVLSKDRFISSWDVAIQRYKNQDAEDRLIFIGTDSARSFRSLPDLILE